MNKSDLISITPKTFKSKTSDETVEAMLFCYANAPHCQGFLGDKFVKLTRLDKDGNEVEPEVKYGDLAIMFQVQLGTSLCADHTAKAEDDMIVKHENGTYEVVHYEEFIEKYELQTDKDFEVRYTDGDSFAVVHKDAKFFKP